MSSSDIFEAMHFLLYSMYTGELLIWAHIVHLTANNHIPEKYRVPQNRPHRSRGEVEIYSTLSLTSALDGGGQRHGPAALPEGKARYPLHRKLGGTQCPFGQTEKLAPTGIRSPERPACSESLYRLRYPGSPKFARIIGLKMLKWVFEVGIRIQELVGELHVIYRISEYINTMVETFWKTESEVYYEELSSFKPEEKGTL
jgi:hypothetical protein